MTLRTNFTTVASLVGAGLLLAGCPDQADCPDPMDDDDSAVEAGDDDDSAVEPEDLNVTRQGFLDTLHEVEKIDYDETATSICPDVPAEDQAVWASAIEMGMVDEPFVDDQGDVSPCRPDDGVNRAETSKMVSTYLDEPLVECGVTFPDVDYAAWYGPYVDNVCAVLGADVVGLPDGRFGPSEFLQQPDLEAWLDAIPNG